MGKKESGGSGSGSSAGGVGGGGVGSGNTVQSPGRATLGISFIGGSGLGTTAWCAPELFADAHCDDPAIDVYSFAIVAWQLLTRRTPFEEMQFHHQVRTAVLNGRRPVMSERDGPSALRRLIADCWQADASSRPSFGSLQPR